MQNEEFRMAWAEAEAERLHCNRLGKETGAPTLMVGLTWTRLRSEVSAFAGASARRVGAAGPPSLGSFGAAGWVGLGWTGLDFCKFIGVFGEFTIYEPVVF